MPPRRQPAPKTESRAGLVVALVFFILTTIILGVVAYMGFDGQEKLRGDADAAKKAKDDMDKAEKEARAELTAYQVLTGAEPAGRNLADVRGNAAFANKAAVIVSAFSRLGVQWDQKTDAAPESLLALMQKQQQALATANDNLTKTLQELEKTKADYAAKEGTSDAAKNQALADQKRQADLQVAAQKAADDAKNFKLNELNQEKARNKDIQEKAANAAAEAGTTIKKLQEESQGKSAAITKFKAEQDAQRQKIVLTDKIQGHVKKVDSISGTAYIDLGAADYVKPGMSFSILMNYDKSRYGAEDELPKKATLTVTQILGEKQSQATIKYDPDVNSIQTPVEIGDNLYKPGWRPGTPTHWALVGHFDLNGLGRDETKILKDRLEKQGIIVDAYLDLNTLKVVGDLNHSIDYLLVGNRPTGETERVIGPERKKAIEDAMNGVIAQAQSMAITVVPYRVFLPVFGIDLPRKSALPYFPGGGVGGAPAGGEKPKDEGK